MKKQTPVVAETAFKRVLELLVNADRRLQVDNLAELTDLTIEYCQTAM